jgi:hypothetical protein
MTPDRQSATITRPDSNPDGQDMQYCRVATVRIVGWDVCRGDTL